MAEGTCRSYVSAIRSAERFAEEHGLESRKLYTSDSKVAKATADELFTNAEFKSAWAAAEARAKAAEETDQEEE